jgi:hypothetical protein
VPLVDVACPDASTRNDCNRPEGAALLVRRGVLMTALAVMAAEVLVAVVLKVPV